PYNTNLPNVIVSDMEINYAENKIYAATFGRGVWTTDVLADSIAGNVGIEELNGFNNLNMEIYPNPNNGEFNLMIEGFVGSELNMEIVNIMGETVVVKSLSFIDGNYQGVQDFNLPDGMYFLKIAHKKRMRTLRFVVN
ncbi:MAG: hypothetical protein ACI837_003453, partial [Crocinitomicaceae bacterium]